LLDAGCSLPVAKYWILVAGLLILDVSIGDFQIFAPVKMVIGDDDAERAQLHFHSYMIFAGEQKGRL